MKKYKFILTFCSLFIFCKNFTYAMEKTQPIEKLKQNNIVCEQETFEKIYENWKSLSKKRHCFLKQVERFNNEYKDVDYSKLNSLEIDEYLRKIEEIFLNIYNFFVLDFKFKFGKTIKNIQNLKYDDEKYEQFKKSYNKYFKYYLETNNKTLSIYNNLMKIEIFNCLQNKFINTRPHCCKQIKSVEDYKKLEEMEGWNKNIKNYLYPIYNVRNYKENEVERKIISNSVPIQTLSAIISLKKIHEEAGECLPLEVLNGLKAVLETEKNKNIFYDMAFKIKEKEKSRKMNLYSKFCESINECSEYLDEIIKNIPKNKLPFWENI